jgi:hypothetical protein
MVSCKSSDSKDKTTIAGSKSSAKVSSITKSSSTASSASSKTTISNNTSGDIIEDTDNSDGDASETTDDIDEGGNIAEEEIVDFEGKTIICASWQPANQPKLGTSPTLDISYRNFERAKQKYNCTVEWKIEPNVATYHTEIVNSTLAGIKYADLPFIYTSYTYPSFIEQGFIRPIDEYMDFSTGWWQNEGFRWKGKSYIVTSAFPKIFRTVTYYNTKILEENGLRDVFEVSLDKKWDWDTFIEYGRITTRDFNGDGVIDQWGIGGGDALQTTILYSNGIKSIVEKDGKIVSGIHEPAGIRTLSMLYEINNVYKIVEPTTAYSSLTGFSNGTVALLTLGAGNQKTPFNAGLKTFKMAPLPKGPDVTDYQRVSVASGGYAVLDTTEYETKDLINFITEALNTWDTNQEEYFNPFDGWYNNNSVTFPDPSFMKEYYAICQEAEYEKLDFGNGISGLIPLLTAQIYRPVFSGQLSVGVALEQAKPAIDAILEKVK